MRVGHVIEEEASDQIDGQDAHLAARLVKRREQRPGGIGRTCNGDGNVGERVEYEEARVLCRGWKVTLHRALE